MNAPFSIKVLAFAYGKLLQVGENGLKKCTPSSTVIVQAGKIIAGNVGTIHV